MLRDMSINKYFEINLHHVNIQKIKVHQAASFIQLRENNQAVLILIKNAHIHE